MIKLTDFFRKVSALIFPACATTLLVGSAIFGCTSVVQKWVTVEEKRQDGGASTKLALGHEAFKKGDFRTAGEIFKSLSQSSGEEEFHRKAIYGLACTKLVLADGPQDFKEAVMLWNKWEELDASDQNTEDPRMVGPFLRKIPPASMALNETEQNTKSQSEQECERLLQAKEKEIQHLKSKLEEREREVQTLKGQIESLEAISQKIQEKKKEISSP